MMTPHDSVADCRPTTSKADGEPTACIDLDRFCEACAYNLRTLPVVRDSRTGIPIVRCTECGRYQAANESATAMRAWLRRVTAVLLALWVVAVIAAFVGLAMAEAGISYGTLDELTTYGGGRTQRINTTTITTRYGIGPLVVRDQGPEDQLFIGLVLAGSAVAAFVTGTFAVVVCPHWRRAWYLALVLVMPLAVGGLIASVWHCDAPHLFSWGMPYIAANAGLQLVGGLLGVRLGRAFARMTVRIVLPAGIRPRLAYLWLTDGKAFPRR